MQELDHARVTEVTLDDPHCSTVSSPAFVVADLLKSAKGAARTTV